MKIDKPDSIAQGNHDARVKAMRDASKALALVRTWGTYFERMYGGQPVGLGFGHILRVNPAMLEQPAVLKDGCRGLTKVSRNAAAAAEVPWTNIEKPLASIYTWVHSINLAAEQTSRFRSDNTWGSGSDFWTTTYLYATLGRNVFKHYWDIRSREMSDTSAALTHAVALYPKTFPGWPVLALKKTVLQQVPYVLAIASAIGSLNTQFNGRLPVISGGDARKVFIP